MESKLNIAIYPGSFDPITNGHIDIIHRSSILFDNVVVAISKESFNKNYLFTVQERLNLIKENVSDMSNVSVSILMDY